MIDAMITRCELALEDTTGSELTPILHYSYEINDTTYFGRVTLKPWKTDQFPYRSAEMLESQIIRVYYDPHFPKRSLFWKFNVGQISMVRNSGLFRQLIWLFFW